MYFRIISKFKIEISMSANEAVNTKRHLTFVMLLVLNTLEQSEALFAKVAKVECIEIDELMVIVTV